MAEITHKAKNIISHRCRGEIWDLEDPLVIRLAEYTVVMCSCGKSYILVKLGSASMLYFNTSYVSAYGWFRYNLLRKIIYRNKIEKVQEK